ncbi:hypothetical protein [Alcanivorax sp.]|uniref:hypothetical protein n=1 Tax=Alcanivorax sp. TaxID=1872427 RepID=UPI000C0CE8C5|nr:hypothetical protein [Alcanivorax sp.]PHR68481.1 MAG: hypothetical protein COA55_00225 [Alcanivorax sp.]
MNDEAMWQLSEETAELRDQVAELHRQLDEQAITAAASTGAFVLLARYLAEAGQVHLDELADDLDGLCRAQDNAVWQRSLIALAEQLRGIHERQTKGGR